MAGASARLLSRRVCSRIGLSSFSNCGHSSASSSSSSAVEALVLSRYLPIFSLANVGLGYGSEAVRFRVYSTGVSEGGSEEQKEDLAQLAPKEPLKPPPRPFKLSNEQRELAEEIGYKVVDRYTQEDFGQNKRPNAFAIVQVCFPSFQSCVDMHTDLAVRFFRGEHADRPV